MNTLHQCATVTADATTPTRPKPPCASRPDDWDLDIGTPGTWQQAVRACQDCPILAQCRELATSLTTRGTPPRSMIWAGLAYDGHGTPIEHLEQHRSAPIDHRPPLRIVRSGPARTRATAEHQPDDTASAGRRRTIVVRRRQLAPTGSDNA